MNAIYIPLFSKKTLGYDFPTCCSLSMVILISTTNLLRNYFKTYEGKHQGPWPGQIIS